MKPDDKRRLKTALIQSFRGHWEQILQNLETGKPSLAKKRYRCFETDTQEMQKKLAEEFYGLRHARKMIALSDEKIVRNLSCYLTAAIEYCLKEYEDDPEGQEQFIASLALSEYVLLSSQLCEPIIPGQEDWSKWDVSQYPADALYSDWYEYSFGGSFFDCGSFILMKSTGEAFSDKEIYWLKKSIIYNIESNEPDLLWGYEINRLNRRRVWVYLFQNERFDYLEEIENLIKGFSRRQLLTLSQGIIDDAINEGIDHFGRPKGIRDLDQRDRDYEAKIKKYLKGHDIKTREQLVSIIKKLLNRRMIDDDRLKNIERIALKVLKEEDFMEHHGIRYTGSST